MKAGLKFSGSFAKSVKPNANLIMQGIDFSIEVVNFSFALYEYNQLKKVSRELESILSDAQNVGETDSKAYLEELAKMRDDFEKKIDSEQALRQRNLESLRKQLEEQRHAIIRIEELKVRNRVFDINNEFMQRAENLAIIEQSISMLSDELQWWESLLFKQFGNKAKETMIQVEELGEKIRELQNLYTVATKSLI